MATSKRRPGDINPNDQILVARTDRPGTDHKQYVWMLVCARRAADHTICGHRYGANGSDFTTASARNARAARRGWISRGWCEQGAAIARNDTPAIDADDCLGLQPSYAISRWEAHEMSVRKLTKRRAKLLAELEYMVGSNCYNASIQNWSAGGVFVGEDRDFRYPITVVDDEGNKRKTRGSADADKPTELITGYYAFGANQLQILMALNKVLDHLEQNHGLKI